MSSTQPFPIQLDRPLAVFDIEATGISPRADRIVELAIVKLMPDGSRPTHVYRINPGIPIPEEATAIHGITDADVVDCPLFRELAPQIQEILAGCDLGGFNIDRYDIPMLVEEFDRAGLRFETDGRRIVDAQRIFHRKEPRDLTAALAFYCGEMHLDAHGAEADVIATIRVLEGQLEKYEDVPRDVQGIDEFCNPPDPFSVDRMGRLRWAKGEVVVNFSAKKGQSLKYLVENDKGFLKWILRSDFPRDVKEIVQDAIDGKYPAPPPDIAPATS